MSQKQLRQPSLEDIKDMPTRRSIQWIKDYLDQISLLRGVFQFFELEFSSDSSPILIPHQLGFAPVDFIQTSILGTGTLVYNYEDMDGENFSLTVSGTNPDDPLIVRFFAGRYDE